MKLFCRWFIKNKFGLSLKKNRVAFCLGKYWSCDQNLGINPTIPIVIDCFKNTALCEYTTFFYDDFHAKNPTQSIDSALVEHLSFNKSSHLIVVFNLPHHSSYPSNTVFKKIARRAKVKIIFFWADFAYDTIQRYANSLDESANLHVVLDYPVPILQDVVKYRNYLPLWSCQDRDFFYNDDVVNFEHREFDVCFLGSTYENREIWFEKLKKLGQDKKYRVYVGGRCIGENLSLMEYANIFRKSKIVVNFSFAQNGEHQVKGRVFEASLCGAMLLEMKNHHTAVWFKEGVEYATFDPESPDDMINKIEYYLYHVDEMKKIAEQGWRKSYEQYNEKNFYEKVFRACL